MAERKTTQLVQSWCTRGRSTPVLIRFPEVVGYRYPDGRLDQAMPEEALEAK